jgi:transporter family-2 protein
MTYLLLPIIAGLAITLQSTLSGKSTKEFGSMETVIMIHLFGLLAALIIYFSRGDFSLSFFSKVNLLPIIAGSLGVVIIFSISNSVIMNGVTTTLVITIVLQLIVGKVIDHFGMFGVERSPINLYQVVGIVVVFIGVFIFQKAK